MSNYRGLKDYKVKPSVMDGKLVTATEARQVYLRREGCRILGEIQALTEINHIFGLTKKRNGKIRALTEEYDAL